MQTLAFIDDMSAISPVLLPDKTLSSSHPQSTITGTYFQPTDTMLFCLGVMDGFDLTFLYRNLISFSQFLTAQPQTLTPVVFQLFCLAFSVLKTFYFFFLDCLMHFWVFQYASLSQHLILLVIRQFRFQTQLTGTTNIFLSKFHVGLPRRSFKILFFSSSDISHFIAMTDANLLCATAFQGVNTLFKTVD